MTEKREREYQCGIRTRDFQAQKKDQTASLSYPLDEHEVIIEQYLLTH